MMMMNAKDKIHTRMHIQPPVFTATDSLSDVRLLILVMSSVSMSHSWPVTIDADLSTWD